MSYQSEQHKQQKQNYLRQQILQKGYDPQHFINFLSSNSQQQIDLQQWDMEQLKGIVAKYKLIQKMQANKRQSNQDQLQNSRVNINAHKKQEMSMGIGMLVHQKHLQKVREKKSKIEYENLKPLFDYEINGAFECIQNQETNVKSLKIEIPEFEIKQTQGFFLGFGSKTEIWFHIKSNLIPGRVKRPGQDFQWLSDTLVRIYPLMILPQLDQWKQDGTVGNNQNRRKAIQEYMQQLSKRKQLFRSQLFINFLTLSTEKVLKYKKSYDSVSFAKGVSLMKSDSGKVEIDLSNNLRQMLRTTYGHNRKVTTIHEKINVNIEKLWKDYDVVKEDLYAIVDNFAQLHDCYSEHVNRFPKSKNEGYSQMLVNLNNLFLGMGDNVKGNIKTVEDYLKNYYNLTASYDRNLFRLSKVVKETQKQYLEYKYQLYRKKERIYAQPQKWEINQGNSQHVKQLVKQLQQVQLSQNNAQINLLKSEINEHILPKESSVEKQMKLWYGFMLKNYESEFNLWMDTMASRYANRFKTFAAQMLNNDKLYLQTLSKFISEMLRFK